MQHVAHNKLHATCCKAYGELKLMGVATNNEPAAQESVQIAIRARIPFMNNKRTRMR